MMVKLMAKLENGRQLYVLCLSEMNLTKLRENMPIRFQLEEIGGEGDVVIMYGRTEMEIKAALKDLIGPHTKVKDSLQ
jgi:hypothetical protein